jgi:hypothetical protein
MTEQGSPDGVRDRFDSVFEVPPCPHGANRYEREDGETVHGDAGGEWTLDSRDQPHRDPRDEGWVPSDQTAPRVRTSSIRAVRSDLSPQRSGLPVRRCRAV